MTEQVLGPAGSPRRRWTMLLPLTLAIVVGLLYIAGAAATPSEIFELEGNTVDVSTTPNLDDWENLYNSGGAPSSHVQSCTAAILTNCFETFAIVQDKIGKEGDTSYFTGGGSKDRLDIPQWSWGTNDQAPDKNDITNAFAAAYRDNNSGVLAFGADRHAVNGDAQLGFWFNQAPMCLSGTGGTCPATTPNQANTVGKFVDPDTGALAEHQDGDILAIVNFDNGGNIGTANVYRWNGTTDQAEQVLATTGQDCKNIAYPADFCTTSNTAGLTGEPPWPYNAKGGGADDDYETSAFIEGFIDLGAISGAGTCFPSFLAETRSSSGPSTGVSLDATLKDFALKSFQLCGSSLATTPKDGAGANIPAGGLSITTAGSITVKDEAAVTVTGIATWSGTVKFWLCGPPSVDTGTCDGTAGRVGTEVTAAPNSPVPVNQTTSTVLSPAATITSAGRYCWRAFFDSSTAGVSDQTEFAATECFTVNPVTPSISTQVAQTVVSPGTAISDKAFLSGTANQPGTPVINPTTAGAAAGGTITFKLYGPTATSTASCIDSGAGANLVFTSSPITVSGDRVSPAFYGSGTHVVNAPGYYHWVATYSGNSPNTNSASGTCGDANETTQVLQIPTTIKTKQSWYPNDTATITSSAAGDNLGANGTVVFTLHTGATCAGAALYTEQKTLTGGANSETVSTSNYPGSTGVTPGNVTVTPFAVTSDFPDTSKGPYSWKVVYTPAAADTSHTGRQSACTTGSTESFSITLTNDAGPGTALP